MNGIERERKFLVGMVPPLTALPRPSLIRQGYIAAENQREARIRSADGACTLTVKTGNGLERREYEIGISRKQFIDLWPSTEGLRIQKMRYRVSLGKHVAELDQYSGILEGLRLVEVKFDTLQDARDFSPPYWFGPEVTGNPSFSNAQLASLTQESAAEALGPLIGTPSVAYGAIPLALVKGVIRVVLISTKSESRWLFPKGQPESDREPRNVAAAEALEEAGVEGALGNKEILTPYWQDHRCTIIHYWPMKVKLVKAKWQESTLRKRMICSVEKAKATLADRAFSHALDQAIQSLNPSSPW